MLSADAAVARSPGEAEATGATTAATREVAAHLAVAGLDALDARVAACRAWCVHTSKRQARAVSGLGMSVSCSEKQFFGIEKFRVDL